MVGGHVWQGMCVCEVCMVGVCMVGETVTAADGTHPTGMQSCWRETQTSVAVSRSTMVYVYGTVRPV